MATAKDFRTDTDNDIYIANGDFAIFESDQQHIVDIVTSAQGSWKEYPLCGVGIDTFINAPVTQQTITNVVTKQLTNDGYGSISIKFENDNDINFEVDAIRG
jgi:hypothetical protein